MKTNKRVLPALLLSLFAAGAAPQASAAQFSGVYVFGDSLSDAGYYRPFLAGLGLPASVVAQLGRFTTNPDPTWAELVSLYYGMTPAPSNVSGGNIFAQGGARVATDSASTPPGGAQRPVSVQVNEYLARSGGAADPNALYAVWAGGNDFLQNFQAFSAGQISQAQLQANFLGAATQEIQQIGRLRGAGARYIAVFALPDIGVTPFALGAGAAAAGAATQLSAGYNTTLFTGLAGAGISVIPVDVFTLFGEIRANPGLYGFSNITGIACGPFPPITTSGSSQFCLPTNLVAPNANNAYLFADSIHPTGATHRIIANFLEALIDGPSNYGLLAESAIRSRESHIRSLADGIALGRAENQVGKFGVFVGGDRSDFQVDAGPGFVGVDTTSRAGTIGVTMRASESVVVGAAYGSARNRGTFGANAGTYRVGENIWSAFASMRWGGFYGTGVLSLADLEFSELKRTIRLGPALRVAEGRSEGSNSSAHIAIGYDFPIRRLSIGPTVSVTTQNITVNQFDESGAGSANLRILEQTRKSEVWSAGLKASYDLGQWKPWVRVTADKERRDDARDVSAIPLSMAAIGSTYSVPTYRPDTTWVTAAVGVHGNITPAIGVSLGYYYVDSRSGIKQDGLSGLVSVRF
jgi:outer membrane lipase/esterase